MKLKISYTIISLLMASCSVEMPDQVAEAYEKLPEEIDFNFHVRPILSDRCYACHGPDEGARKADLRLDLPEEAKKVVVAGNLHRSALVHRVLSDDPEEMMPPAESKLELTDKEKAILIKWVKQGAGWKEHWAFNPPIAMEPPVVIDQNWPQQNQIDQFVYEKIEQEGMTPNPEADKQRLLRRVTMDLTGLPPTIEEIEAFVTDQSPESYEKVVDKLLQSSACAERLAVDWMDLSRYADSHGLHADGWRMMWPWRDWVIKAFNSNMPYDQFVIWQLAGDLIPEATIDQKLATAFNRNNTMTSEGGAIDEEFRVSYVFDRTETVVTAFQGLTMNCARCHDHKFDPLSQKDYYAMTAFFNNIRELGMTGRDDNHGPMLPLLDGETELILKSLKQDIDSTQKQMESTSQKLMVNAPENIAHGQIKPGIRIGYYPLETLRKQTRADLDKPEEHKGAFTKLVADNNPNAVTPGEPLLLQARVGKGLKFRGSYDELYLSGIPNFEWTESFSGGMWFNTTKKEKDKTQTLMATSGQKNSFYRGWDFYLDQSNRLNFRLISALPTNYIQVTSLDSISVNQWVHAFFTYDGSGKANGIKLYLNGIETSVAIGYDHLYKSAKTRVYNAQEPSDRPVKVAKNYQIFAGDDGLFKGTIDEIEIYGSNLTALEVASLYEHVTVADPINQMNRPSMSQAHWTYYQPVMRTYRQTLKELRKEWLNIIDPIPEVMVMEEMAEPRVTYAYNRGVYDQPMYAVKAGTPEIFGEFPEDLPKNRLGLAKWLFRKENPLTARVTVNRYWQMIFGKGLVTTPQDFGVQGALPTHPQLLDWLAVYFQDQHWDVKALLKLMVMSHTYRQSSESKEDQRRLDPENVFLARGASYRLSAEMIRDNALAASGLLVRQVGGRSVRPYQPEGLWFEKTDLSHKLLHYKASTGDSLYRRSLYTFIRRTSPHPAMTAFDAPDRNVCLVKRERTNTPLQALVLLNDPQFVECSRVLAQRIQHESGGTLQDQITHGFRLVTGRRPKNEEIEVFRNLYHSQLTRFEENPKDIDDLMAVGAYPVDTDLNKAKTASLTIVASTMINHDEAYMKR